MKQNNCKEFNKTKCIDTKDLIIQKDLINKKY